MQNTRAHTHACGVSGVQTEVQEVGGLGSKGRGQGALDAIRMMVTSGVDRRTAAN